MKLTAAQRNYGTITKEFADNKDACFVANVIMTACGKAGTKLANLYAILCTGVSVRTAQFDMWTLIIDGKAYGYGALDRDGIFGS